jgi:putative tryptophan/tyrosine transport system substrate-binding protein
MKRRAFITLLGGAAVAWPLAAYAQQPRMERIGFMVGQVEDADTRPRLTAFRQGLEALGWVEGRNIEIVARFDTAGPDRTRIAVAEMLRLSPDVIVTSNEASVSALMKDSPKMPIIYTFGDDPVAIGFAESFAHPGGNVTGFTTFEAATATKWLQLLREIAPGIIRVAVMMAPISQYPSGAHYVRAIGDAASSLGIEITASVRNDAEVEQLIESFARQPNSGLIVAPSGGVAGDRRELIARLAARHRLPAVYPFRYFPVAGGLMSYGPDLLDLFRRAASYVDRIFKGARPADLPIQQPTKFELVINLKTARALGLEVPNSIQLLADEVIE